jgi:hypothetical protein
VHAPEGDTIRLLDVWSCPRCCTEQWALIEIVESSLHDVTAVTLDRGTLASANFISEVDVELLAESLSGRRPVSASESVRILLRALEE